MGHHHNDHEERPEVSPVVARLDAVTPWHRFLVYSTVDGETVNVKCGFYSFIFFKHELLRTRSMVL